VNKLNIQVCPETGICSIMKTDGSKVDLMPDEVQNLRLALGNGASARKVLAEVDADFAKSMAPDELKQLAACLK
jgi:hypothetical protein